MSIAPVTTAPDAKPELLAERFQKLAAVWRAETGHLSSTSAMTRHPAFLEIVAMGDAAVPLLLRELDTNEGHWHRVLKRITGADPVSDADRGDIAAAREAWLKWGRANGYRW
jgi:hypothetical protein